MSTIKPKVKQKRKQFSLETKGQILDRLKLGEKIYKIANEFNVKHSTIIGIRNNENQIRKRISLASRESISRTVRVKNNLLAKTEKCLIMWIEHCRQNNIPLDGNVIRQRAKKLFENLKKKQKPDSGESFLASNGWFDRFKKRYSLNYLKLQGELSRL